MKRIQSEQGDGKGHTGNLWNADPLFSVTICFREAFCVMGVEVSERLFAVTSSGKW